MFSISCNVVNHLNQSTIATTKFQTVVIVVNKTLCQLSYKVLKAKAVVKVVGVVKGDNTKAMFQLEKWKGFRSRYTCPACKNRHEFSRYVDENGNYLADYVGRCNRDSKCGYHFSPKDYFLENPHIESTRAKKKKSHKSSYSYDGKFPEHGNSQKPDYIRFSVLQKTLDNYEHNSFVRFLLNLFNEDSEIVWKAVKDYLIGTFPNWFGSYTCFPYIDRNLQICKAKLIRFNRTTGKRLKNKFDTSSLVAMLKLKKEFQYKQVFFGEHLLEKYPDKPVAVVESEKTAVIASICLPQFVWLGSNSKTWLKQKRLAEIGLHRQIILYPDGDGFDKWQKVASNAQSLGQVVSVSSLIETCGTKGQKTDGYDLADYIIAEQSAINKYNAFVDNYNNSVDMILSNENLLAEFEKILEEQKAESKISELENIRLVVLNFFDEKFA